MAKKLFLTAAVIYDGATLHAGTEVTERCDVGTVESLKQRGLLADEAPRVASSSKVTKIKSGKKASDKEDDAAGEAQPGNAEDPNSGSSEEVAGAETEATTAKPSRKRK